MWATLDTEVDPMLALDAMIELSLAFSPDEPDRARFLYTLFFGPLGTDLAEEVGRIGDALDCLGEVLAARLAAASVLDSARVEEFLAMLRGAIVVRTVDYLFCGQGLESDRAGRLVADLLDGFGVGPRKARTD